MLFFFLVMEEQKPANLNRLPMLRLQRDIDALFAARKTLTRTGKDTIVLSSQYLLRDLPQNESPILFLLHAPKKFVRRAHERNKLKRWMREAIRTSDEMKTAYARLNEKNIQALVVIRASEPPSKKCSWENIVNDIGVISRVLEGRGRKYGHSEIQ
jgi:ribonuclease P protein component